MSKILNTSYNDPEVKDYIDQTLGKAYSFIDRFQKRGIGSSRMLVSQVTDELRHCLNADHYPTYSSIELRPQGILVHFNRNTITHAWVIPFYSLSIFLSTSLSIHSQGNFVRFKETDNGDLKFMRKILDEKIRWGQEFAKDSPSSETTIEFTH